MEGEMDDQTARIKSLVQQSTVQSQSLHCKECGSDFASIADLMLHDHVYYVPDKVQLPPIEERQQYPQVSNDYVFTHVNADHGYAKDTQPCSSLAAEAAVAAATTPTAGGTEVSKTSVVARRIKKHVHSYKNKAASYKITAAQYRMMNQMLKRKGESSSITVTNDAEGQSSTDAAPRAAASQAELDPVVQCPICKQHLVGRILEHHFIIHKNGWNLF